MTSVDLATLAIDDFRPHLGSQFDVQAGGGTIAMKLSRVDPAGDSGRKGGAFSLIFLHPAGRGCRSRSIRCGMPRSAR